MCFEVGPVMMDAEFAQFTGTSHVVHVSRFDDIILMKGVGEDNLHAIYSSSQHK